MHLIVSWASTGRGWLTVLITSDTRLDVFLRERPVTRLREKRWCVSPGKIPEAMRALPLEWNALPLRAHGLDRC